MLILLLFLLGLSFFLIIIAFGIGISIHESAKEDDIFKESVRKVLRRRKRPYQITEFDLVVKDIYKQCISDLEEYRKQNLTIQEKERILTICKKFVLMREHENFDLPTYHEKEN